MSTRIAYASCPLCDDPAILDLFEADCRQHPLYSTALPAAIEWCRCHRCNHVFTAGYFNDAATALIFSTTLPEQSAGHDVENQRAAWAAVVERVTSFAGEPAGGWLDVGFGNGALLFTAAEWGYAVTGLDLRGENVARLQALGFAARCGDITGLDDDGAFGVISMADVIEHMPFPRPALARASRLLAADGLLFISTPNTDTAVWKAMDAQQANPYWGEIEHYHCFSRGRLYALLRQHGFEPLHYAVSTRYRSGMDVIARKRAA